MNRHRWLFGLVLVLLSAVPALADTVFVDLSGIDGFPGLTDAEKATLKAKIKADIQANFNVAIGAGKITVTTDPGDAAGADRRVNVNNDMGTHKKADGSTGHHYGEWPHGGKATNVHLKNFYERHAADYKTGGKWDLEKLRKGIGRTAAHEVAHSYSVGHNGNKANPNKMTRGGLVPSATRANTEWIFDAHTATVLKKNLGKKPCATTTDYDLDFFIAPIFYETPDFPDDPEEYPSFDAQLFLTGPLADQFNFGWFGRDSDGGVGDGSSRFDFIYKASAAEPLSEIPLITFIEGAHDQVQFLLEGRQGTPLEGQWFSQNEADILAADFVATPAGDQIFRDLTLAWDLDGDFQPDVTAEINSLLVHEPYGAEFNGFLLTPVPEPSAMVLALVALGALGVVVRRRTAKIG